jgi:hypothetical protein
MTYLNLLLPEIACGLPKILRLAQAGFEFQLASKLSGAAIHHLII